MTENFEIKFNGLTAHKAAKTPEGWVTKCNRKFKYMDEPTSATAQVNYECKDCFQQKLSLFALINQRFLFE